MNGNRRTRQLQRIALPVLVFILVCTAIDVYVRVAKVPTFLMPRPMQVLQTLVADVRPLLVAVGATTRAAVIGFAASIVFGVVAAVAMASSRLVRLAFFPYTIFFQTVPIIAIAPMLILWFDAGLQSVAICAFIVSVFPIITNTLTGLRSTDPALIDLFRLHGANWRETLWKLRLPAALPSLFSGLRVAAGLAVIGTVVAELLVGEIGDRAGLGVTIYSSAKYGRPDRVFAAVILTSLLGLSLFGVVNLVAHLVLRRWHASENS